MANRIPSDRTSNDLIVEGARQNNLKNISLRIPHNQRHRHHWPLRIRQIPWRSTRCSPRAVAPTWSPSTYARMFLDKVNRPDVDRWSTSRPAIAIEQKNPIRTARSTVGTATELADLLRLLSPKSESRSAGLQSGSTGLSSRVAG